MAEKVVMPKLGATMESGTIDSWLIEVGEEVEEGDPVAEVQTDKITMEIEAESTGVLLKKLYEPGDTVPVQQVIAYLGGPGEEIKDIVEENDSYQQEQNDTEIKTNESNTSTEQSDIVDLTNKQRNKIRRTPIARKIAEENNISLENVIGTGPNERVQKIDVEDYLSSQEKKVTPLAKKVAENEQVDLNKIAGTGMNQKVVKDDVLNAARSSVSSENGDIRKPFKGMRKVIADRISDSFYSAPHVTLNGEVDITRVIDLRKQLLPVIEDLEGVRVSYNEVILKAVAYALKKNQEINISLDGEDIIQHNEINIGMAVDVPDGLVVPVVRSVDQKGLAALTRETKALIKQAHDGKLSIDDMNGSTFSISNLGMYAVDEFTPIINQPNAAILGIGRIIKKPVVAEDDTVTVRSMMTLSLSFDHRIVDGAPAARFLTDIKEVLEQPYKLIV